MPLFLPDPQPDEGFDLPIAVVAGLAGSAAYLAAQAVDIAATRERTDDVALLGMLATRRDPWWRVLGLGAHFVNGALLGTLYARFAHDRLPGPPWLRGTAAAQVENLVLWLALIRPLDRVHPGIRAGRLPTYDRPAPFAQSVWRHLAYGAALGAVYAWLRRQ
jgi:hypothetical protein